MTTSELLCDADLEKHLSAIADQGYTVVEDALDPDLMNAISEALDLTERDAGIVPANNDFEGRDTIRIYNLLARGGIFEQIPVHPMVLPVIEGVLDDGCLISSLSSITIGPGETPQLIHSDDQVIGFERPHQAVVCNSMWALSDFTEANGATRLDPESHRWDHGPDLGVEIDAISATMRRGSVLIWHGSLWHGGGANASSARRMGIVNNYCAGFLRQEECQLLALPREQVAGFSPRLRRLVGYGTYKGLLGHVDQQSPETLVDPDVETDMIWGKIGGSREVK